MPRGKIHDSLTLLIAPIVGVGCFLVTRNALLSAVFAAAFLFGGLMFGPDLDTNSRQIARWWVLRPIWMPYRLFFSHRSRWTHGLLLGSLLRVIYFMGFLTVGSFIALLAVEIYTNGKPPSMALFADGWRQAGAFIRSTAGFGSVVALFAGLWTGAASHTLTDLAGTYIKTGRVGKTL
jgi:uncharacterized metal-binding protein